MAKKWIKQAIEKRPPFTLGWKQDLPREERLERAYLSCPERWTHSHKLRRIIAALNLVYIANRRKNPTTAMLAKSDQKQVSWDLKQWHRKHPEEK